MEQKGVTFRHPSLFVRKFLAEITFDGKIGYLYGYD